jgi:steroid delta-isomerase-like uncharacterized protein
LDVAAEYAAALAARDNERMHALRTADYVLDYVHNDAFQGQPISAEETRAFWSAWFAGFPEMDFEVTRTVTAETVVVIQWTFTGANTGPLAPPAFGQHVAPTGRTVQIRGVSIYDLDRGLIQRETLYIDYATLWVELGVEL